MQFGSKWPPASRAAGVLAESGPANWTRVASIMNKLPKNVGPTRGVSLKTLLLFGLTSAAVSLDAQTSTVAASEETDESNVYVLSPFTVTNDGSSGYHDQQTLIGSRSAKDLLNVPAAVSIINRELLDDLGAVSITEAVTYGVSGVTANLQYDDFNIRGFRVSGNLRNGVRVKSFKGQSMYDIERVEVIKGPAAMLLGVNEALGGVVNLVSKKPTAQFGGQARATIGDNGYMRGEVNVSGPLHKSDDLDVMYRLTLGGTTGDRKKDMESLDQAFIGGAFLLYLGKEKNSSLNVNWYWFQDDSYLYASDFLDLSSTRFAVLNEYSTKSFSAAREKDVFFNAREFYLSAEYLVKVTANSNLRMFYTHADGKQNSRLIRGITLAADGHTLARQDIPLDVIEFSHTFQLDYLHRLRRTAFTNDFSFGGDYRRQSQGQDQLVLSLPAIDVRAPDLSADDDAVIPVGSLPPFTSSSRTKTDSVSYYVQNSVSFWDERISVIGGLRWIDSTSRGVNRVNGNQSETANPVFRTHKYGALFKVLPTVTLYYTNAENLFLQSGFTNEEVPRLRRNQEGQLDEIGVKMDRRLSENIHAFGALTYFDMALTNVEVITGEFNSRGELIKAQSAQNTSKGWEVDFGISATVGSGRFDSVVTYYNADTIDASTNAPSKDSVKESYSIMGKYAWLDGPLKGLMLGAGLYDQGPKINSPYLIDFPTTYNVFGAYRFNDNWRVQLNVNNVTDKRYVIGYAATGLVAASEGLSVRAALDYKW